MNRKYLVFLFDYVVCFFFADRSCYLKQLQQLWHLLTQGYPSMLLISIFAFFQHFCLTYGIVHHFLILIFMGAKFFNISSCYDRRHLQAIVTRTTRVVTSQWQNVQDFPPLGPPLEWRISKTQGWKKCRNRVACHLQFHRKIFKRLDLMLKNLQNLTTMLNSIGILQDLLQLNPLFQRTTQENFPQGFNPLKFLHFSLVPKEALTAVSIQACSRMLCASVFFSAAVLSSFQIPMNF